MGAIVVNAVSFLPHSRPRLFVIGLDENHRVPKNIICQSPNRLWHPTALIKAKEKCSDIVRTNWVWWDMRSPVDPPITLSEIIEENPTNVKWHSNIETERLICMMNEANQAKLHQVQRTRRLKVGCIFKRTRVENGKRIQRAEIRFDEIAGCLRTPGGGSSKQILMIVRGESVRSRAFSPRETARLMGLPESYRLPDNLNDGYRLTGDGVAVPVVRHIAAQIFEPCLREP